MVRVQEKKEIESMEKEKFVVNVEHLVSGLAEVCVRDTYSGISLVRRTYDNAEKVNALINNLMQKITVYNSL